MEDSWKKIMGLCAVFWLEILMGETFSRSGYRWENNIKMDLRETASEETTSSNYLSK
jgi:hypothetical protein